MRYEWSEWIEHDGRGCPVKGQWVKVRDAEGWESGPFRAHTINLGSQYDGWDYQSCRGSKHWPGRVVAYRVRRPRIVDLLSDIDAEVRHGAGAMTYHNDPLVDATQLPPPAEVNNYSATADELLLFIERFEQLEAMKAGIAGEQNDLMAEAKGRGYDTTAMRKVIALRKRKPDDIAEDEAVLEIYLQALGMR